MWVNQNLCFDNRVPIYKVPIRPLHQRPIEPNDIETNYSQAKVTKEPGAPHSHSGQLGYDRLVNGPSP